MGWRELLGWIKAMHRQREGAEVSPDSWRNADRDAWWAEARRKRDEDRAR